jgi:tape measure domain-containing protein
MAAAAPSTAVASAGRSASANGLVYSIGLEKYIGRANGALVATRPLIQAMGELSRTAEKLSTSSAGALAFRGDRSVAAAAGLRGVADASSGAVDSFSRIAGRSSVLITRLITLVGVLALVAKWKTIIASGGTQAAGGFSLLAAAASLASGKLGAVAGGSGLFTAALRLLPGQLGAVGQSALAAGLAAGVLSGGVGPLSAGFGMISAAMGGIPGKLGNIVTACGTLLVSFGAISAAVTVLTATIGTLVGIIATVGPGLAIGVKLAAEAEQAQIAFDVMLGSADAAFSMLNNIRGFAIKTPFSEGELISSARALIAFGESADNVIPALQRIGDVSSGIGAPIGEIAEIYGKARVQGRLFAQDINQLTGRGIPVIQELAKQFGVTDGAVKKLVADGKVDFGHLEKAFISLTSAGGVFFGLTERQSQSLAGIWSSFKDSVGASLRNVGQEFVKTAVLQEAMAAGSRIIERLEKPMVVLGKVTAWAIGWLVSMADTFADVALVAEKVVSTFSDFSIVLKIGIPVIVALSVAILAVVAAQKAWAVSQIAILALGGPAGWAKIAAGTAIAAAGIYAMAQLGRDAGREMQTAADRAGQLAGKMGEIKPLELVSGEQMLRMEKVQEYLDKFKPAAVALAEQLAEVDAAFAQQAVFTKPSTGIHPAFMTVQEREAHDAAKVHPAFQTENQRKQKPPDFFAMAAINHAAQQRSVELEEQLLKTRRAVIDASTGVYTETKKLSDELELLRGRATKAGQKEQQLIEAGVPAADAQKVKNLMQQVEAQEELNRKVKEGWEAARKTVSDFAKKAEDKKKEDKEKAKTIVEANRSPLQKLQADLKEVSALQKAGLMKPEDAALSKKRLLRGFTEPFDKPRELSSIQGGTAEALKSIFAAISTDRKEKKTEDLLSSIESATLDQNATLSTLGEKFESGWQRVKAAKF